MCLFKKIYEDVLTISLECPEEYILRLFTLHYSSTRDCFQYVLYEKYNIFGYHICHIYDKIHSRMHQIAAFKFFSCGSMLALAFSPHSQED